MKNVNGDIPPPALNCVYCQRGIYIPTRTPIAVCARVPETVCEPTKDCGFEVREGESDATA